MTTVQWFSQKGIDCLENRDFGAYVKFGGFQLTIVVDSSQKGKSGRDLSRIICKEVVDNSLEMRLQVSNNIIEFLRSLHERIRFDFINETACYAISCIDDSGIGWAMSCGDCRVGVLLDESKKWLTPVHTLANLVDVDFGEHHAISPDRHRVTRCWKSNRFILPEITNINIGSSSLLLATDGFWIEHEMLKVARENLSDDSSYLVVHANDICVESFGENFIEKYF